MNRFPAATFSFKNERKSGCRKSVHSLLTVDISVFQLIAISFTSFCSKVFNTILFSSRRI